MKWSIVLLVVVSFLVLTQTGAGLSEEAKAAYSEDYIYAHGADTYYYMRIARDGSTPIDTLRLAPEGVSSNPGLYPSIMRLFPSVEIAAYWLPVILGILSVLLVYMLGLRFSEEVGLYGALVFAMHPLFVTWNYAGFADTNAINMFFTLAIVYSLSKVKENIAWGALGLGLFGLFWMTWTGAFYILAVVALIIGASLLGDKIDNKLYGVAAVLALLLVFFGRRVAERLLPSTVTAQQIQELKPVVWPELVQGLGGYVMLILTVLSVAYVVYFIRKKDHMALIAWCVPVFVAGLLSRRFLFLFLIHLCVLDYPIVFH